MYLFPSSAKMLVSPRRASRKIPKAPFKVLDAPDLQDDYYLNLLDWSSLNVLSVGLGSTVYLWNASTCQVNIDIHVHVHVHVHVHCICTCTCNLILCMYP